jgi:pimeloyl-ACP methyl ester carboxylesterase
VTESGRVRFDDPLRAACPATCPRLPDEERIGLQHRFVEANGLRFHLVEAGSGPMVLLLHGFPEFWYAWRRQIPALAARFRVVAPDLRGYNLSDKPASSYNVRTLATDVPALIRALGEQRAHVVGHDWGGMLAWTAAAHDPDVVDRLAIMNAPYPAMFLRELTHNPKQWLKSWYIGLFQIPGLPEWLFRRRHARPLASMLRGSSLTPEAFSDADLAAYRRAALRPGAMHAALAYYREMVSPSSLTEANQLPPITAPTILIWGMQDTALASDLTQGVDAWVPQARVERIPDASHWVQHERPEQVNRLLLEHLTA